jgi:hypothetical protein
VRKLTLDEANTIIDAALAKARGLDLASCRWWCSTTAGTRSPAQKPGVHWGWVYPAGFQGTRREAPCFHDSVDNDLRRPSRRLPGGVIIRDADGSILGAVGVSGDVSEHDEICAVAGVEAAGLDADIGDRREWRRP